MVQCVEISLFFEQPVLTNGRFSANQKARIIYAEADARANTKAIVGVILNLAYVPLSEIIKGEVNILSDPPITLQFTDQTSFKASQLRHRYLGATLKKTQGRFFQECSSSHPNLDMIRSMLEFVSPDFDWQNTRPFHAACTEGHLEVAKILRPYINNIDAVDNNGYTALMYACGNGDEPLVRWLLEEGADRLVENVKESDTTIIAAILGRNVTVLGLMCQNRNLNQICLKQECTPLMYAVARGFAQEVQYLLGFEGIRLDIRDLYSRNVLHHAVLFPEILAMILQKKPAADILNAQDLQGKTPFYMAVFAKRQGSMNLLLEAGADPYLSDDHGVCPYAQAVRLGLVKETLEKDS